MSARCRPDVTLHDNQKRHDRADIGLTYADKRGKSSQKDTGCTPLQ